MYTLYFLLSFSIKFTIYFWLMQRNARKTKPRNILSFGLASTTGVSPPPEGPTTHKIDLESFQYQNIFSFSFLFSPQKKTRPSSDLALCLASYMYGYVLVLCHPIWHGCMYVYVDTWLYSICTSPLLFIYTSYI